MEGASDGLDDGRRPTARADRVLDGCPGSSRTRSAAPVAVPGPHHLLIAWARPDLAPTYTPCDSLCGFEPNAGILARHGGWGLDHDERHMYFHGNKTSNLSEA
jgi:hypothetical protein